MTERPMLFNGDMVRAILSGRKTQTRRPMKVQPPENWGGESERAAMAAHCQNGVVGDRIWVRETWLELNTCHYINEHRGKLEFITPTQKNGFAYRASFDHEQEAARIEWGYDWKPSIHMPKDACRLFLEITDVRVQRVQEISALGALREGINPAWEAGTDIDINDELWPSGERKAIKMFFELWNSCYGKTDFSWNKNPWVWALTFKRVEGETK